MAGACAFTVAGWTAKISEGRVLLPLDADRIGGFRDELRALPSGRHDDQVDSLTRFLAEGVGTRVDRIIRYTDTNGRYNPPRPKGRDYMRRR